MFKNAGGNFRFFTVQQCIFAAHYALQFGKFNYHAGNKVGFAQKCAAAQFFFINRSVNGKAQHFRHFNKALALVVHIAQTFLEGNSFKFFQTVFQFDCTVFVKEELGIAQTCAQYAFIAVGYNIKVLAAAVAYGNKFIQQISVFVKHREISLVFTHRSNNAFFRQAQEFFLKLAAQSCRPFNKVVYFFKQIFVNLGFAVLRSQILNLLQNQRTAFILVNHNKIVVHNFFVIAGRRNFHSAFNSCQSRINFVANFAERCTE